MFSANAESLGAAIEKLEVDEHHSPLKMMVTKDEKHSRDIDNIGDSESNQNDECTSSDSLSDEVTSTTGSCDEGRSGYRMGGYHPVTLGSLFNGRYRIQRKLGWGHFSTVWMATDEIANDRDTRVYALKVQKSAQHYNEAAIDEVKLLQRVLNSDGGDSKFIVRLYEHFDLHGPNGQHMCMVFEVLGDNLLSLIQKFDYRGLPLELVREISRNILSGLDFLHTKAKIIHTDLKPENILLTRSSPASASAMKTQWVKTHCNEEQNAEDKCPKYPLNPEWKKLSKNQKKRYRKKINKTRKLMQCHSRHESNDDKNGDSSPGTTQRDVLSSNTGVNVTGEHINSDSKSGVGAADSAAVTTGDNNNDDDDDDGDDDDGDDGEDEQFDVQRLVARAAREPIVKLADLGNACLISKHFTNDITTRQYRSPEAIVGAPYSCPVDIWALGALVFELLTGDYLFNPKQDDQNRYTRDDDHLALMSELLGSFPRCLWQGGHFSKKFFRSKGKLRNIRSLEFWPLHDVLKDKYKMQKDDVELLVSFLMPMLALDPMKRATASECLQHPWLRRPGESMDESDFHCSHNNNDYDVIDSSNDNVYDGNMEKFQGDIVNERNEDGASENTNDVANID